MENKIKVGDYIRTKEWGIAKVNRIDNGKVTMIKNKNNRTTHYFTQLKEPSQNIIDLIEEGDYVNGIKIYSVRKAIGYGNAGQEGILINKNYMNCKFIPKEDIKSIVTKEQFKSVEYEV